MPNAARTSWQRVLAVVCSLALPGAAAAATGTSGGASPYLRDGIGARALGMGNAYTAAVTDATAAYWNPAALAALAGSGLSAQTAVLGEERALNFLNYVQTGRWGTGPRQFALGLSWIHFSAGENIEARTYNRPEPDYLFGASDNAYILSAASQVSEDIAVGCNFKILNQNLDADSALGSGWDLAVWHRIDAIRWGLVLQDLYSVLSWPDGHVDRLPTCTRGGVEWRVLPERLRVAAEGGIEFSHAGAGVAQVSYRLGAEYQPWEVLTLRAGLDQARFTAGAGVVMIRQPLFQARLDYALAGERLPGSGLTHLFSLILDFPPRRLPEERP